MYLLIRSLTRLLFSILLMLFFFSVLLVILLRWIDPPTTSFMLQNKFSLIAHGKDKEIFYTWCDFDKISNNYKLAIIASEDQKFLDHNGFDIKAIQKAMFYNAQHKRTIGASTISQQVAKNLFLWPSKSYFRKALEAYFTVLIESIWDKKRILEVYMNVAELGPQIYGIGSASHIYFNREPDKLTKNQSALLASVLPNPIKKSVNKPTRNLLKRKRWVLKQMNQLGGTKQIQKAFK